MAQQEGKTFAPVLRIAVLSQLDPAQHPYRKVADRGYK